jgi:hypothetical protein
MVANVRSLFLERWAGVRNLVGVSVRGSLVKGALDWGSTFSGTRGC